MNAQQMEAYLRRIGYTGSREHTGAALDALIRAHLAAVPFENLTPYDFGQTPSLEEEDLYRKLVTERRGGYCFELNTAFRLLLTAMGFEAYPVVVRILDGGPLRPYAHEAVIAAAEGSRWYCDVGYGGPGPKGAVELRTGEQEIGGALFRVELPEGAGEILTLTEGAWTPHLRFPLHPIEPCDFIPLNHFMGGIPGFAFREKRIVNLTLPDGSKALTGDHLTIRRAGEVTERELPDKAALERALREEFGLEVELP